MKVCARELSISHGATRALAPMSFELERGQCVGLLGLNGAGKTTLLRALAGELLPTTGQLSLDDVEISASPQRLRDEIGYLPEPLSLDEQSTPRELLRWTLALRGLGRAARDQETRRRLEDCGLGERADQPIHELSHGYKKRVGMALALTGPARLLLLDEPFAGLDPAQVKAMSELIAKGSATRTTLISSHQLAQLELLCDRVMVLHRGELLSQDLLKTEKIEQRATLIIRGELDAIERICTQLEVRIISKQATQAQTWSVELDATINQRETLNAALVRAGLSVQAIIPREPSLEAMFLGLTHHATPQHDAD